MIVNNGMKGSLIRNAGLPGYYYADVSPADGSQRMYNLLEYSAKFGGSHNLSEPSEIVYLDNGVEKKLSFFDYAKTVTPEWFPSELTPPTLTFKDSVSSLGGEVVIDYTTYSTGGHRQESLCYLLPPETKRVSVKVFCVYPDTIQLYVSPIKLLQKSSWVSGSSYNNDSFVGIDVSSYLPHKTMSVRVSSVSGPPAIVAGAPFVFSTPIFLSADNTTGSVLAKFGESFVCEQTIPPGSIDAIVFGFALYSPSVTASFTVLP